MISLSLALQIVKPAVASASATHGLPWPVLVALFWIAAVACLVAQYFIVRAVWKVIPSGTSSPQVPVPNRGQEIMWVLLPLVLLTGVFVGAWRQLHSPVSSATSPSTMRGTLDPSGPRA